MFQIGDTVKLKDCLGKYLPGEYKIDKTLNEPGVRPLMVHVIGKGWWDIDNLEQVYVKKPREDEPSEAKEQQQQETQEDDLTIHDLKEMYRNKRDMVNNPEHYKWHPSGVECIDIIEAFPHNIAAAIGYCWRADHKGKFKQDIQKAIWHLQRELKRRETTV